MHYATFFLTTIRGAAFWALVLLGYGLLTGCSQYITTSPKPLTLSLGKNQTAPEARSENITGTREASEEESKAGAGAGETRARVEAVPSMSERQQQAYKSEAVKTKQEMDSGQQYTLEVENMDLIEFIHLVFGKILELDYVLGQGVTKKKYQVTVKVSSPISEQEMLRLVTDILNNYDLRVEQKDQLLRIERGRRPTGAAIPPIFINSLPLDIDPEQKVFFIYLPDYIDPESYLSLLDPLTTGQTRTGLLPESNYLFLEGRAEKIQSLQGFLRFTDRPFFKNKQIRLFYLDFLELDVFRLRLEAILPSQGVPIAANKDRPGINFIELPEINALLAVASQEKWLDLVGYWQRKLDTPSILGDEPNYFIYRPQNRRASNLKTILDGLLSRGSQESTAVKRPDTENREGQEQEAPEQAKGQAGQKSGAPARKAGRASVEQVIVDEETNALVLLAYPTEYKKIKTILDRLDNLPKQVLVEVTIGDITIGDSFQFGVEWEGETDVDGYSTVLGTLESLGLGSSQGLNVSVLKGTEDFQAALNAFSKENRVNILSTPRLVVLDNQSASINVGNEVPLLTESTSFEEDGGATTSSSIEYRSTGIILNITPTIHSGGMLTLDISQEISEAQTNDLSDIDSPVFLNRNIDTSVILQSGDTVLLGGLIKNNKSTTVNKVPFLGDLPVMGHLFKNTSESLDKTELFIQITPHILSSPDEARIFAKKYKELFEYLQ